METNIPDQLIQYRQILLEKGITTDSTVCLSIRQGDQISMITPVASDVDFSQENICLMNVKETRPVNPKELTLEMGLHRTLYRNQKKMNVLIHSHQMNIMTASRADLTIPPLLDDFAQLVGVDVKVVPYSKKDETGTVTGAVKAMKRRHAVLLNGNGAICGGMNFEDALAVAQVLEKGCRAFIETEFLGGRVRIKWAEAWLMRLVYLYKYSKMNDCT